MVISSTSSGVLHASNLARAAGALGDTATVHECAAEIERQLCESPARRVRDELHGRKAVDAAFNCALAGVDRPQIYDILCEQAEAEVARWGRRKSCDSMTLAQLAERTAAAGCRAPLGLFELIQAVLVERGEPTFQPVARSLAAGDFGLASSASAVRWVHRAAIKQSKIASASADGVAAGSADWGATSSRHGLDRLFDDGSRPLTVDLGCGYGCGPLNYAASTMWQGENILGCDLSAGGIQFARGLASRWDVSGRCRFVRDDARAVLRRLREHYPGGVSRVILSCPTPYAVLDDGETGSSGNTQLPQSLEDPTFLGHKEIFDDIYETLAPGGHLYLASNVEDVALALAKNGKACGLEPVTSPFDTHLNLPGGGHALHQGRHAQAAKGEDQARGGGGGSGGGDTGEMSAPRRQQRWRSLSGERAVGGAWDAAKPMMWASETERTLMTESRPVHRAVLVK